MKVGSGLDFECGYCLLRFFCLLVLKEWNTKSSKWIPLDDPCHVMVNHRIEWAHDKKFCNESVGSNL